MTYDINYLIKLLFNDASKLIRAQIGFIIFKIQKYAINKYLFSQVTINLCIFAV